MSARAWVLTVGACLVAGAALAGVGLLTQPPREDPTPVLVRASDDFGLHSAPVERTPIESVVPTVHGDEPTAGARPTSASTPLVGVASRLVIPDLGVDLPVVSERLSEVPENPDAFPLCDVAQYLVRYVQPGQSGTTYLFGHARPGMLGPLLDASKVRDGEGLLGSRVLVYTSDARLHVYEIFAVKRHATDFTLADELAPGEHRLILQTSEGPRGTVPKLQVAARPVEMVDAAIDEALPSPVPRICG